MIGGVIITGSEPKRVIFRVVANSMQINRQPVAGRLQDSTLTLHDGAGIQIAFNDDWIDAPEPERTEIMNSGVQPKDQQESAILRTLAPGAYTAIVRGANASTGIAVVQAYDLNPSGNARLANLSTRAFVDTNDNLMIGGAMVGGNPAEVVIRGLGPSLQVNGVPVPGRLVDPTLSVVNANGQIIAENDNYDPAQIPANLAPPDPAEAAIRIMLPPGRTTMLLRGKNDGTGVGLIEIYDIRTR